VKALGLQSGESRVGRYQVCRFTRWREWLELSDGNSPRRAVATETGSLVMAGDRFDRRMSSCETG
jgi:hypothetical protein